jgi:hypothetical protein
MVWPAPRTKTSSRFALQEATLGPALKEPPRSSQSLHCGPLADGVGDEVTGRLVDGLGGEAVARAAGRTIRKRPVPASSSTVLPKITGSDQRRWVLIMRGSTTKHNIPLGPDLSAPPVGNYPLEMITSQ